MLKVYYKTSIPTCVDHATNRMTILKFKNKIKCKRSTYCWLLGGSTNNGLPYGFDYWANPLENGAKPTIVA